MVITRWQAPITPTPMQVKMILEQEGLEPFEETYKSGEKIKEHRHPFGEIRLIMAGELLFNIAGNQVLLRAGDRIEIPANTKHSHTAQGSQDCVCVCAFRPF